MGGRRQSKRQSSVKSKSRKSVARKSVSRKSVSRKSVARKSVAKRKSSVRRQSSKQTAKYKSVSGKGTKNIADMKGQEEQMIHGEPIIGPHIYFIMTGFYDLDLVLKLVQLKVPVNAVIAIGEDPSTIRASGDEIQAFKSKVKATKSAGKVEKEKQSKRRQSRKSVKRKSTSRRQSSRKSVARKSAAPSRKSMAKKKSIAGGRKSMAKKKSIAGGSRKSVARKSAAGGSRKSVARKSVARKSTAGSKGGVSQQKGTGSKVATQSSLKSGNFWKNLNFQLDQLEAPEELKDVAVICLNPRQLLNLEKMAAESDAKTETTKKTSTGYKNMDELVYQNMVKAVYDLSNQMRNLAYYSKNITVKAVAKARPISEGVHEPITKHSFVSKYQSLLDLIPQTMITIEYILYCLVEHVQSTVETESDTSLQEPIREDNFKSPEMRSRPPLIFHKDYLGMTTMTLNVEGLDLPFIHYNIYKHMPYCKVCNNFQPHFVPNKVKQKNHLYKFWRSVDARTEMPYDLFHTYVNHTLFQKMYNFQQEPLLADERKVYEAFVPIISELSKFDPFASTENRFQEDAYKLKSFLECQEVLSLFNFPFHSSAVLAYNFIEELDNSALLQNLQISYSKFQYTNYLYYPPTDSLLLWFNNSLNITEVPTQKVRGILRTPVGLRDYYKYVQYDEALWLAYQKEAIEAENKMLMSDYLKTLQEMRKAKGYDKLRCSLTQDLLQTTLPENKIGNGNYKETFDLGNSRIENEEKVTVFNSTDGAKITVKVCKWVRASDTDLIITVDSYDNSFTIFRNIENQFGEKGKDDNNIGLEVKTKHGDIISYRIKKQISEKRTEPGEELEKEGKGTKNAKVADGRRKSQRKSTASRKSMKRKSTARASKAGRKSSAGRKSQAPRKSKAGRKSQVSSQVGRRQSVKGKRESALRRATGEQKERDIEGPREITDYCFQVTSSSGLQSFFNNKYSEDFIKQEYDKSINNTEAADEDYRLYLKDGTVLVYNTSGQINTLYPNGSYLKVYDVGKLSKIIYKEVDANKRELQQHGPQKRISKRKSTAGERRKSQRKSTSGGRKSTAGGRRQSKRKSAASRKSAAPRKSTAKRQSTASKRKSAAPRKSTARRQSRKKSGTSSQRKDGKPMPHEEDEQKETVLEGEEITYYDIIKYDWIDFEGNVTKYEKDKPKNECKQAYRVRAAEDQRGQLYVVRTDGSKILFGDDGTLRVQYWDGTAITSTPVIEFENLDLDEMANPEVSKEKLELRKVASEKNVKISQPLNSTNEKVDTETPEKHSKLPFAVYSAIQDVEHPCYYRVQSHKGMLSMLLPGGTVVENPSRQLYNVYFGDSMAFKIKERTAQIYCRHPHEEPPKHYKDLIPPAEPGITKDRKPSLHSKKSTVSKKSAVQKKSADTKKPAGEPKNVEVANVVLPAPNEKRFTKINIQLLELEGKDKVQLLSATDSSGRTFKVFNDGSVEYTVSSLDNNNRELYDHCFSDFNKFFVIDKDWNGYEFINLEESTSGKIYYPFDIQTFHERIHEKEDGAGGYLCKGLKPEDLKKSDLSRYLDFPKDRWLFHMAPFKDRCETYKDIEAQHHSPPPKAILWGTRKRLRCPNFDVTQTLKKALYKYMLYQMRILKKYLQYLSIYDITYHDSIDLPRSHLVNMGILKLESKDEKTHETIVDNVEGSEKKENNIWGIAVRN